LPNYQFALEQGEVVSLPKGFGRSSGGYGSSSGDDSELGGFPLPHDAMFGVPIVVRFAFANPRSVVAD